MLKVLSKDSDFIFYPGVGVEIVHCALTHSKNHCTKPNIPPHSHLSFSFSSFSNYYHVPENVKTQVICPPVKREVSQI